MSKMVVGIDDSWKFNMQLKSMCFNVVIWNVTYWYQFWCRLFSWNICASLIWSIHNQSQYTDVATSLVEKIPCLPFNDIPSVTPHVIILRRFTRMGRWLTKCTLLDWTRSIAYTEKADCTSHQPGLVYALQVHAHCGTHLIIRLLVMQPVGTGDI